MSDRRVSGLLNETSKGNNSASVPASASEKLRQGLLSSCEADLLEQVSKDILELTNQQDILLGSVEEHNKLLQECPQLEELKTLMDGFKTGLDRLSSVRQEISSTHDRCLKLKVRAEKIKETREDLEQKMHSNSIEEMEPCDLFFGLGLLIGEGRLPCLTSAKGFYEGPHCSTFVTSNPKIHRCESDNFLCGREENLKKHVDLIWSNNIPLCIEVLLCSDCSCGNDKANSTNISVIPDSSYVLIEQWSISASATTPRQQVVPRGEAIEGKSLLQAVRSYLHFSQLAAWLSKSKEQSAKKVNVMYRITMPMEEEVFTHKFVRVPEDHEFPTAIIKNHTIKVKVKSLPRSERVPTIYCSNLICPVRNSVCLSGKSSPSSPSEGLLDPSPICHRRYGSQSPSREPSEHFHHHIHQHAKIEKKTSIPDDRLPQECQVPGKHNCACNQDHELGEEEVVDEVQPSTCYNKLEKKSRNSKQDLFLQTLTNRLAQPVFGIRDASPRHCYYNSEQHVFHQYEQQNVTPDRSRDGSPVSSGGEDDGKKLRPIPTIHEKLKFQKSLDSASNMIFHGKKPINLLSPAPVRKGQGSFDFDSTLTSPTNLKSLFGKYSEPSQRLLGSFEESVMNGRIDPVSTVEGFTAEIGASGSSGSGASFCPPHLKTPVSVFFYNFCDSGMVATPYLAHINLGKNGYAVPKKGTVQVTLFNPNQTVIKMFVVMYDLSNMPVNSQTFIRQRTFFQPLSESNAAQQSLESKNLRYLIHLRFSTSKSGKLHLHTDIRIIIFRKSDVDSAITQINQVPHELISRNYMPKNPMFSPKLLSASSSSSPSSSSSSFSSPSPSSSVLSQSFKKY